jgi:8-oxo-dGTP diphosphatase
MNPMHLHPTATVFVLEHLGPSPRLLFVRHGKGHLAGLWLPPGGHLEPDERPDEAAVREVREETGLFVDLLDLAPGCPLRPSPVVERIPQPHHIQVEAIAASGTEPAHRHLDYLFVAVAAPGSLEPVGEPGRPVRWLGESELDAWPVIDDARLWARLILREIAALPARSDPAPPRWKE